MPAMVARAAPEKYNLESVTRTVAVLKAVQDSANSSLDHLARAAGLSESTALRYLSSLATHDLVERDPVTGLYRLGLSLFSLGASAIQQRDIVAISAQVIDELRDRFDETINLAARQHDQVMVLQVIQSRRPMRKGVSAGGIDSWHATALGKALLAALPDQEVDRILERYNPQRYTPNTLADPDALRHDLHAIRGRGYAIDDEESEEGLRCAAVAIMGQFGRPEYALSISGPKSRMAYGRLQEIGTALMDAGRLVSVGLGVPVDDLRRQIVG